MPKVAVPRDVLAGRGQGRRKQKGTDVQMDWIYCSSMSKKKPKGHYGPTREQNDSRLTDSGGQGGGNGFILSSQVYKRTLWGAHDRGQMNGCKPPGNPKPYLKGTWKGRGADCMEPMKAVCSNSATESIPTVEGRGDNQTLGVYNLFFHSKHLIIATGGKVAAVKSPKSFHLPVWVEVE